MASIEESDTVCCAAFGGGVSCYGLGYAEVCVFLGRRFIDVDGGFVGMNILIPRLGGLSLGIMCRFLVRRMCVDCAGGRVFLY